MTREELFRAVGEVREDQIEAAGTYPKKQDRSWRRYGALAACLALVVTAVTAASWIEDQERWKAIVYSFQTGVVESGEGDAGGGAEDMDGCEYWSENPDRPLRPDYSVHVEIGELAEPGDGEYMGGVASCSAWLSPEEIFAQDTVIFRGTVREMQYYQVEPDAIEMPVYYTKALIEVTDPIRGDLKTGETVSVLWLGAKGYMTTSLSGPLDDIQEGSDAIFMPTATDRNTGWREGDSYFCYADLAELYLSEGIRYVFLDTGDGVRFDQSVYLELENTAALDEVAAYIREITGGTERTQPAAVPAVPQTEPSETRQANLEEADPGYFPDGPSGARELPGGALAGE